MNPDEDRSVIYSLVMIITGIVFIIFIAWVSPEPSSNIFFNGSQTNMNPKIPTNNTVINQEIYTYNYTLVQHEYKPIQVFYPRDKHKCSRHAWKETISGQSMLQAFPVDDQGMSYAYIDRVIWSDIRLGDIILFNKDSNKILHAVVYKNEYYLETAGYNNIYKDDWRVEQHEVIGRVCENDY